MIEHGRNAGRRLLNSAALVAPVLEEGIGELTMGSFSSHETDGFILLNTTTYTNNILLPVITSKQFLIATLSP